MGLLESERDPENIKARDNKWLGFWIGAIFAVVVLGLAGIGRQ